MSKITIKRSEEPYARIPKEMLRRKDISMKAKGLLSYLLGLPNDWKLYKTELVKNFTDGKDSVNSAFNELVYFGYIEAIEKPKKAGKFDGYDYTVSDIPLSNRCGFTAAEKPEAVNPPLLIDYNTNNINNLNINEELKNSSELYKQIVEYWLKEFHEGWTFKGAQGKALKSLIVKIRKTLKDAGRDFSDLAILDFFKAMCQHLPEWYKEKDLLIIDSKFNELISEIKKISKNGSSISNKGQSVFRTNR